MKNPYVVLSRKRRGEKLEVEEIQAVVDGATTGSWDDSQLAAFLMAAAIRGLDPEETTALTVAMLESGEQWSLSRDFPTLGDKHSTGGVGDKVSLILSPLLAACGQPVVMLTGRGLGHTGGTADKLESIPGLDLAFDRARCAGLLEKCDLAIGMATGTVAPADRKLYSLRDVTGTVESIPLIVGSILSKKLATGAAGIAFDVKTGSGAFMKDPELALALARQLVETCESVGVRASALLTDMSQPLGNWVGHSAEVQETMDCLAGDGPADLMEVVYELSLDVARLTGLELDRAKLEGAISSGAAREKFLEWVAAQGGDAAYLEQSIPLAPEVRSVKAVQSGFLASVDNQRLGHAVAQAGGGRLRHGDEIDVGVSLERKVLLGQAVEQGQEIARLYLRRDEDEIVKEVGACYTLSDAPPEVPALVGARV